MGENGRLSFSLLEPMQPPDDVITTAFSSKSSSTPAVGRLFEVGESRGEINLLFSPDREVATLYEFTVRVVDHGEPPRSAVTRVRVTIRDTNDCQPQFERSNYEFYVQVIRFIYLMFLISEGFCYLDVNFIYKIKFHLFVIYLICNIFLMNVNAFFPFFDRWIAMATLSLRVNLV